MVKAIIHRVIRSAKGAVRPLCLLACLPFLASCGDFWESESADMSNAMRMTLGRRVVTLVEGDRYCIPVNFTPDSLLNNTVYWESLDDSVVTFVDDTLVALTPGLTRVVAFTTIDRLRDTCWVQVMPPMQMRYGTYPYEMMVYASVNIHGKPLTVANAADVTIGAYVDNELRGIGVMRQSHGIDYLSLRVESPFAYGEQVRLRCYYTGKALVELFPDVLTFTGDSYGTLSDLYPLILDDKAETYEPDIADYLPDVIIESPDTLVIDLPDAED